MAECNGTCPYVGRITKLETQHDHILPLINKMDAKLEAKLDQVILSLSKVEVLESKQLNHSDALGRAFERIEAMEKQTSETARTLADLLSQIKGMTRMAVFLWTIMGGAVGFLINRVM